MSAAPAVTALRLTSEQRLHEQLKGNPNVQQRIKGILKEGHLEANHRRLLARALRATESLVPGVMKIVRETQAIAGLGGAKVEVYIIDSPQMNAFCIALGGGFAVVYSARLLERMTDGELAFVTGHEFGHAAFDHLTLPSSAMLVPPFRVEPPLALSLMSWNRRAELSCDRVGLLCSRNLKDAATALIKISSGLGGAALQFSLPDYMAQLSELQKISPSADDAADWYASHPFSPLRVAALHEFWSSELAPAEAGTEPRRTKAELDTRIEAMLRAMEPETPAAAGDKVRDLLLWAGLLVVASDDKLQDSEKASLTEMAGAAAVQEALVLVRAAGSEAAAMELIRKRVTAAAQACRDLPAPDRSALIQRLIVVARADQDLAPQELAALRSVAELLGLNPGFVDKIVALFA